MSFKLFSVLFLAFLLGCNGCSSASTAIKPPEYSNPQKTLGQWQYSVTVRVYVECSDGNMGTGSGVAISKDTLLTAEHVITLCGWTMPPKSITIWTFDGAKYPATVLQMDADIDFAHLSLDGDAEFKDWAPVASVVPELDSDVCSVGGDFYVDWLRKCGNVVKSDSDFIFTSLWTKPGNSGGPLFQGRNVIGLVVRARMNPQAEWMSLSTPAYRWMKYL